MFFCLFNISSSSLLLFAIDRKEDITKQKTLYLQHWEFENTAWVVSKSVHRIAKEMIILLVVVYADSTTDWANSWVKFWAGDGAENIKWNFGGSVVTGCHISSQL